MNLLIVSKVGQHKIIENSEILPRVGDKLDIFYYPHPSVTGVLLYPSDNTIKDLPLSNLKITALIFVE